MAKTPVSVELRNSQIFSPELMQATMCVCAKVSTLAISIGRAPSRIKSEYRVSDRRKMIKSRSLQTKASSHAPKSIWLLTSQSCKGGAFDKTGGSDSALTGCTSEKRSDARSAVDIFILYCITLRIRRRRAGMERSDTPCHGQPEGQRRGGHWQPLMTRQMPYEPPACIRLFVRVRCAQALRDCRGRG